MMLLQTVVPNVSGLLNLPIDLLFLLFEKSYFPFPHLRMAFNQNRKAILLLILILIFKKLFSYHYMYNIKIQNVKTE